MPQDSHGLAISTASAEAAEAFDRTVASYLKFRLDTRDHLARTLKADPEFGLAQCVKGYFVMLLYNTAAVPVAAEAARKARALTAGATKREQAHVDALEAWIAGDLDRMLAIWEAILAEHPTDVLAFRLAHFQNFWLGRPRDMLASVERVFPHWGRELPGYATLLSCRCFANEECGDYAAAEPAGRQAIEIDPADLWGAHAVAHVMEMQGRPQDGIAWLDELERHWEGGNQFLHHLWWHRALFHYERREFDTVLDLYDRRFRNLESPLTKSQPDFYLDIQNAASMLFRLERQGVAVASRWTEIADKAQARIGDCLSAFTLPHWMLALAASGRDEAAERLLDGMREFGSRPRSDAAVVAEVALPIAEAVLANRRGEHARALDRMRPALAKMHALGGSHAQQDVLAQLFLDSALKADRVDDVRLVLAHVKDHHPMPLDRRVGYAQAARHFLQ
jgi:tetratricopeptide (TPR) repeat protein